MLYFSSRVLRFLAYLEVMALLEEQYSELKQIHSHKLFHHMPRAHYVPSKSISFCDYLFILHYFCIFIA